MTRSWSSSLLTFAGTWTIFLVHVPVSIQAQQPVPVMEYPIITWTNMARQYYGRSPVTLNPLLTIAAQRHAFDMAAQEYMSHTLSGMSMVDRVKLVGYPYAAVGENVAYNFGYPNPDWKLFESWVTSPGHWQNIMNGQFTEIGVGVARSASGKFYACQVFGRPAAPMSPYTLPYQIYGAPARWAPPAPQEEPGFNYLSGFGFSQ